MNGIIITLVIVIALWSVWGFFGSRVEQAQYTVDIENKEYEIRTYPEYIVAQTTVNGTYTESMNKGFSIVAKYIFGANAKSQKVAMTAPVVMQSGENISMTAPVVAERVGEAHTISFGMPRSYTLETLPIPTDDRVKILTIPTKKYAVLPFSWYRSDKRIETMKNRLLLALQNDKITTKGDIAYAGYNAPWTPPWMIRNEVMVEII